MRKKTISLSDIKDEIVLLKGKMVDIKVNKGRKKYAFYVGEVVDTFPAVFTLRLKGEAGVLSYSYKDVICGTVQLSEAQ